VGVGWKNQAGLKRKLNNSSRGDLRRWSGKGQGWMGLDLRLSVGRMMIIWWHALKRKKRRLQCGIAAVRRVLNWMN